MSCNLFNPPTDDYWEKINEEIRWANADPLKITVAYHGGWGSSPQLGLDRCFDAVRTRETPRRTYPFNLEFSPTAVYGSTEWRAYLSDSLPEGWEENPLVPELSSRTPLSTEEVSFSQAMWNSTTVTVWITEPVTIVPYSKPEPRMVEIFPPFNREHEPVIEAARTQEITITFAAALDPDTVIFGDKNIIITCENDDYSRYYGLSYDLWRSIIRITPGEGTSREFPPVGHMITIKLGEGIQSMLGNNPLTTTYEFSFSITAITPITEWSTDYNGNTVTVKWKMPTPGEDAPDIFSAWFRMNGGMPEYFEVGGIIGEYNYEFTIPNVPQPDDTGVRSGINVRDIREYHIFLEISKDNSLEVTSFKIWNIPGMFINATNTVYINEQLEMSNEQIRELFEDEGISNIVLTSNITLENWEPVDLSSKNFYGNGHTVTINSLAGNLSADIGLFGTVKDGTVRDLTVVYDSDGNPNAPHSAVTINPTAAAQFGGIAGTAAGNAQFINVLVKGAAAFTVSGNTTAYTGGLVGRMGSAATDTASIFNAYGGLNLSVETQTGRTASGAIYVGGISGSLGDVSNGSPVSVEEVSVAGDITVGSQREVNTIAAENSATDGLFVGGITGFIRGNSGGNAVIKNSDYKHGAIMVTSGLGSCIIGGMAGRSYGFVDIENCFSQQSGFNITKTPANSDSGQFYVGGFVGDYYFFNDISNAGTIKNCYSIGDVTAIAGDNFAGIVAAGGFGGRIFADISYCYAQGNVTLTGYSSVYGGGFAGIISGSAKAEYSYATGNVSIINIAQGSGDNSSVAGGFAGFARELSNCYATGNVFADIAGTGGVAELSAGGLIGESRNNFDRCFAIGSVTAQRSDNNTINAGGLVGRGATSITNSAALGSSITATGSGAKNVGRVLGSGTGTYTNNRANNNMALYVSSTYAASIHGITPTLAGTGSDFNDGEDAHDGNFRLGTFWQNTMLFSPSVWDFSESGNKRHPILRGVNGVGLLGGQ